MAFLKVAGVAAFGLSLTLTPCDHSSNNNLGFAAEDDLFASASSSSGDLGSSASTEGLKKYMTCDKIIEGQYLKYLYSDGSDSDYAYFKCENGEWKRVDCLAPEAACTNSVEGKIDSTKGLLPLESRTQDVNTMTCRFTCSSGKWTRM